jgi:hypothetical protein
MASAGTIDFLWVCAWGSLCFSYKVHTTHNLLLHSTGALRIKLVVSQKLCICELWTRMEFYVNAGMFWGSVIAAILNFQLSSNGITLISVLIFSCIMWSVFNLCGVHETHDNCWYVYYTQYLLLHKSLLTCKQAIIREGNICHHFIILCTLLIMNYFSFFPYVFRQIKYIHNNKL